MAQERERKQRSDGHADDPREGHALAADAVREQQERDGERDRREHRVLERTEAHRPDARLAARQARELEGIDVEREAAPRDEEPEAAGYECADLRQRQVRPRAGACALPIGKHVAEIAGDGRAECDRQPDHVRVDEAAQHVRRARDEGEPDQRAGREGTADDDEGRRVHRVLLQVRRRDRVAQTSGSGGSHSGSIR
jgi:hypothetical protein